MCIQWMSIELKWLIGTQDHSLRTNTFSNYVKRSTHVQTPVCSPSSQYRLFFVGSPLNTSNNAQCEHHLGRYCLSWLDPEYIHYTIFHICITKGGCKSRTRNPFIMYFMHKWLQGKHHFNSARNWVCNMNGKKRRLKWDYFYCKIKKKNYQHTCMCVRFPIKGLVL